MCGEISLLRPALEGIWITPKGLWMGKSNILKCTGYEQKGCIHEWIWPHIVIG